MARGNLGLWRELEIAGLVVPVGHYYDIAIALKEICNSNFLRFLPSGIGRRL